MISGVGIPSFFIIWPNFVQEKERGSLQMWKHTQQALKKLESLLICSACQEILKDPHVIGSCEHLFCRACIVHHVGMPCPVCSVPSDVKDFHNDIHSSTLVQLCMQLQLNLDSQQALLEGSITEDISLLPGNSNDIQMKLEQHSPSITNDSGMAAELCTKEYNRAQILSSPEQPQYCTPSNNLSTTIPRIGISPSLKMRKNARGETPLHLATIKGGVETVKQLLSQGADPNVKDNAGWAPLHEACNHGHLNIVELLLKHGALVNMPGLDNETPLHDAVMNNRLEVVQLLLLEGAKVHLRNARGLTALDVAPTEEVKYMLEAASSKSKPALINEQVTWISPLLTKLVLLGTGLSSKQKSRLQMCADLLGASVVHKFTDEVTHLIASCDKDGACHRTLKYLHAVLSGKWIVNFDWVETTLEYGHQIGEEAFEVPGTKQNLDGNGPMHGRLNAVQVLPPLFDGCKFYFKGTFTPPSPPRDELAALVKRGGGTVLHREPRSGFNETDRVPYHASHKTEFFRICNFVVVETAVTEQAMDIDGITTCVPVSWLLDSIDAFALQNLS